MNIKFSLHIIGNFLKYLGLLMLVPIVCSVIYREDDLWAFIVSALITSVFGFTLEISTRTPEKAYELQRKDGFLVASLCWITAAHFGAIPYMLYGVFTNPADAVFEAISGFTTTGSSVLRDIESLPHGILFWRSFTQWLGGGGIIVLGVAILPRLAVGGMQLMALETTGPTKEKITPRIAETAKKLWVLYLLLTALMIASLYLAGMPVFESILHTFATLATGGYSPKNLSIAAYNSPTIEIIIIIFMIIGGTNFILQYGLLRGNYKKLVNNPEFRFYIFLNIFAVLIVSLDTWRSNYPTFIEALRYSSFQVISIGTTTGFATANFDIWPSFSKWTLLILMFFGACAGSTSGAIKDIRVMVLFKKGYREIYKLIYPKAIVPIRIGKDPLSEDAVSSIASFFLLYIFIFLIGSLLVMAIENLDIPTAISACATTMGNVGPGFGKLGPVEHFGHLSSSTKVILSLLMLIGRLELFTILVLFTPAFWKK
ncbi:MAG TPA: TrkH family potassium uptake protein [Thermodesulfobacteriota bacterium]